MNKVIYRSDVIPGTQPIKAWKANKKSLQYSAVKDKLDLTV